METAKLTAKKRTEIGKEYAKRYRREGFIPSIIYGQGQNINILVNQKDFNKLTHHITKSTVINLDLEGKNFDVLIKEYERDYLKDNFIHIDFYELNKDKVAVFKIPFRLAGNPMGVREGGILVKHLIEVTVECLPKDAVSSIEVNIEPLNIGDSIHIRDLKFDEKLKVLSHGDEVIVHISGKEKDLDVQAVETEAVAGEAVAGEAAAATEGEAVDAKAKTTETKDTKGTK